MAGPGGNTTLLVEDASGAYINALVTLTGSAGAAGNWYATLKLYDSTDGSCSGDLISDDTYGPFTMVNNSSSGITIGGLPSHDRADYELTVYSESGFASATDQGMKGTATTTAKYAVLPKVEPATTVDLSSVVGRGLVTSTATVSGGSLTIIFKIFHDSAMSSLLTTSFPYSLADGESANWVKNYHWPPLPDMAPGTTYYIGVYDSSDNTLLAKTEITVPHYTTKVFKEWQKDGVKYDFATPVTEDITLDGVWSEVYKVTFLEGDGVTVLSTQNVVQDSDTGLIMPPDPTWATGFVGWVCSLDGHIWDNNSEDVISEMTLKAKYTGSHTGGGSN